MSPDKEQQIFSRWPQFFVSRNDPFRSGMGVGFRCEDGWFQIIWGLLTELEPLARELETAGKAFEIQQVKQKFGVLRVAVCCSNDAIDAAIENARQRSAVTCESCGGPGVLAEVGGWWATLCDACRHQALQRVDVS